MIESPDPTITLTKDGDWWVSRHVETGVASQGRTRKEALEMLDEAVALHRGEIGEPVEDEAAFLEEIGLDPEEIEAARAENRELPDVLGGDDE